MELDQVEIKESSPGMIKKGDKIVLQADGTSFCWGPLEKESYPLRVAFEVTEVGTYAGRESIRFRLEGKYRRFRENGNDEYEITLSYQTYFGVIAKSKERCKACQTLTNNSASIHA